MRRRPLTLLALAAIAAGGCGGGGADSTPARGADGEPGVPRTLALRSQLSAAAGVRRAGRAPGSQMVLTGMLFRPAGRSAIGRSQGACTRTAPGRGEVFECLLSFVLRDGVIHGQAMSSADGPAAGVVTGGTERYRNASGTFRYEANGTPRVDLTFELGR